LYGRPAHIYQTTRTYLVNEIEISYRTRMRPLHRAN
jgi:hypothetical protein